MNKQKCKRCDFQKSRSDGGYCCRKCKINKGHGPSCKRVLCQKKVESISVESIVESIVENEGVLILNNVPRVNVPHTMDSYLNSYGFSGSESAIIEYANALSIENIPVVYSNRYMSVSPTTEKNIHYTTKPTGIYNQVVADIYERDGIYDFGVEFVNKDGSLVIWCHVFLIDKFWRVLKQCLISRPDIRLMFVCVCQPVKDYIQSKLNDIPNSHTILIIPNAINEVFLGPFSEKQYDLHCFHAVPDRGLEFAQKVASKMGRALNCMHYVGETSQGKLAVKSFLDKAGYFVYPLVLPVNMRSMVHHDTYACVIHEAMARGVIVITWDVAVLRHIYGDNIVLVPPPVCQNYDPHAPYGRNENMNKDSAIELFIEYIQELDSDVQRRETLRENARTWAQSRPWNFKELIQTS